MTRREKLESTLKAWCRTCNEGEDYPQIYSNNGVYISIDEDNLAINDQHTRIEFPVKEVDWIYLTIERRTTTLSIGNQERRCQIRTDEGMDDIE